MKAMAGAQFAIQTMNICSQRRVPACVTGHAPRERPPVLDTAMLGPDNRLEIFRYTKRFIVDHYLTRSLRCRECVHASTCSGMHVNYVRAHGFSLLQPVC